MSNRSPTMAPPSTSAPRGAAGPLQSRQAPNAQYGVRTTTAANGKVASTATAASSSKTHAGATTRAHPARQAPRPPTQQQAPPAQQQQPRPQPQSRLEREKKKDYKDPPNIGPWQLGKLIGQGASGRVRIAQHAQTGQQAAVKIVPRQLLASSRMSLGEMSQKQDKLTLGIEREIVIMKLIEHPNLLGLWDVYETSKELFLVMEYVAGGELFDHLVAKGRLRPHEARAYFRQIIFGVDYCHRFNICHRDLKPENLLLDGTKRIVKVADFGMAALQPVERMLETSCGSPHYASPEIVSGKSYKGSASDIWSCGIILFALLCGRLPFDDPNITRLLHKVRDGRFDMPDALEPAAKDLIWRMLEVDPEKRYKMTDIMRHPWFTNNGAESSVNPSGPGEAMLGVEAQLKESEIDVEILKNLKSLWPENSTRSIVKSLTSPGSNWQKTFYSLLCQHRDNHSMDDESEEEEEEESEGEAEVTTAYKQNIQQSSSQQQTRSAAGGANSLGLSLGIVPNASKPAPTQTIKIQEPAPARTDSPSSASRTPVKPVLLRASTDVPTGSPRIQVDTVDRSTIFQKQQQASSTQTPTRPSAAARGYSQDAPRSPSPAGPRPVPGSPKADARNTRTSFDAARAHFSAATPSSPVQPPAGANLSRRITSPSHRDGKPAPRQDVQATPTRKSSLSRGSDSTSQQRTTPGSAGRRPVSVHAPAITVPQVGDATVQRFFQEIAAELASIRAASPVQAHLTQYQQRAEQAYQQLQAQQQQQASQQSQQSQQQQRESRRRSADVERNGTSMSAQPAIRLAPSPITGAASEFNQFEDADEDPLASGLPDFDRGSVHSSRVGSDVGASPYTPTSPLPPQLPGFSPVMTQPLSISDKAPASDFHNGRLSSRVAQGPFAARPISPAPSAMSTESSSKRASSSGRSSAREPSSASTASTSSSSNAPAQSPQPPAGGFLGKRRSILGMRSKHQPANQHHDENHAPVQGGSAFTPLQARLAQNASQQQAPTRLQQRNPGLGLDLASPNRRQQNASAPAAPSTAPLPSPVMSSAPPTPRTPSGSSGGAASASSAGAGPSAKQSWFAGLFNWKPLSLSLHSYEGFIATQMEVKRLLLTSGAKVFIEDSESLGMWRCSLKDNNSKTLRFRIEFTVGGSSTGSPSNVLASPALSVPGTPQFGGAALLSPALSSHSRSSADSVVVKGAPGTQVYSTKITFHLEKGSNQTFKNMYNHMARDWHMDVVRGGAAAPPQSPALGRGNVGLGVNV